MSGSCIFCLEDIQEGAIQNPIGCSCKILAHESCFTLWFQQKQSLECPICHTVSVPTPFHHENLHVVFVREERRDSQERQYRSNQKAMAMCCCLLLGWSIGLTILEAIYSAATH